MTGNELNVARVAMSKFEDLTATLMNENHMNRVRGYAATNDTEWEKYDQLVNQKQPDQSMMDPVKYANGIYDKAAAWGKAFAATCDFVRSDGVIWTSKFSLQLDSLNHVIRGY